MDYTKLLLAFSLALFVITLLIIVAFLITNGYTEIAGVLALVVVFTLFFYGILRR